MWTMATDHPRRGRVTPEHVEEAKRLRAIWNSTREARAAAGYGTQEAFGEKFSIGNQAAVGFFLSGKTALSMKAALGFARGLGVHVGDFSPRLAEMLPPESETPKCSEMALALAAKFDELHGLERRRTAYALTLTLVDSLAAGLDVSLQTRKTAPQPDASPNEKPRLHR